MITLLLLFLVAATGTLFYLFGTVPALIAWLGLFLGARAILLRTLAWFAGPAPRWLAVRDSYDKTAVKAELMIDGTIWGLSIFNIFLFLQRSA